MFTLIAFGMLVFIAITVQRTQRGDPDRIDQNTRHARQDLRLIAYLLVGILVMLGVIADRVH